MGTSGELRMRTLREAKESRPVLLCPFCEWIIPMNSKKPIKQWHEHLEEDKCYEEDDYEYKEV